MMNNNKKLIYLFFDKTTRIEKNGETKIFPSGKYIATEGEYNKFELKKYREITLSFVHRIEINNADDSKQTFEQDKEYSMPKYKFDKLNLSKAQWAKLTLDCVLKNILELPFEAFNYLNNSALDRIGKIFFDQIYDDTKESWPGIELFIIKEQVIKETKKYEEEIYTRIISQRPELVVFFNIRFLYEKLILDKSQNVFKISFKKYINDIKNFNSSNLYDHDFYKFLGNIREFDDSNEITGLEKKPSEILLDFIGCFFEDNPKNSNLALICLCINEMDSDYLTSRFFSGEQNAIQEIYDALFEDGTFTKLAKLNFLYKVKYKNINMPLCSGFFVSLVSKLKYKAEYKDKFLELISFGGYKNYNGEYEFPVDVNYGGELYWADKLELLRFIDPNFIRDNLDNNLVQKYLKNAVSIHNKEQHEDCLKKIAEYREDFHGTLKSKEDYLLKLVEIGLIEYVDTKFICDNIDNEIIKGRLSEIKSIDKQKDLFNYFHGLYKDKNKPEEIEAIDKKIDMLMNYCKYIIGRLDKELIVNNLNKSYICDNIYTINSEDRQKQICDNLYKQYQDATIAPKEQKQKIIENVLFLIQAKYCGHYINYFDNDFIVELLLGESGNIVENAFEYMREEKAQDLCAKLCEKYENSTDDKKRKCKGYIIKLIKTVKHMDYNYSNVASYLSGQFVLDHLEDDIIKKEKPSLILKTCQYLCNKYSESQGQEKENYKNIIIQLLNDGCLDAPDLSIEFIVECVFETEWLKRIDRHLSNDVQPKIRDLVEYLCDKYKNNEMDKSDCTNKIFQLINIHEKAVSCLSVEFIAENFDTDIIQKNLKNIDDPEKQKDMYNHFYGKYNKAKNDKNEKLENINKNRIIKLINERAEIIINADIDIEFICENWSAVLKQLKTLKGQGAADFINKLESYLKNAYFINENNEPDFERQKANENKVLEWTEKINKLINLLHPKFIAENLSHKVILSKLYYLNNKNLNSLYDYICNNYDDKEKKDKILVLIKECTSSDCFISKQFLYDNFGENIVQGYMLDKIKYDKSRLKLWKMLYECYLSDNDKEAGKEKLLNFIKACNGKISFWHWYDEINIPFVCDCLGEEIIQKLIDDLRVFVNKERDDAKTKMKEMFEYLCKAQKEYESKKVGKDRTADILKLIDIFRYGYGIQYVNAEFIYKNFYTEEVRSNLDHITTSQGKELVNCIKNHPKEDEVEQYFLKLISVSDGFANYMDIEWIYQHLGNETIQKRLYLITKKKHIQKLYNCIVTPETSDENEKKYILIIANSYRNADMTELHYRDESALTKFLCVIDAKFILDNLDDSQDTGIKEMVKLCLSSDYDFGEDSYAQKFALRKLICAIELVEDKLEQDKLYLKLLNTLDNSANIFRYTSVKFLEDRVDSENKGIKKYIAENIYVQPYQYEYGKNAETIKKSENINKDDEFIVCLFDDISENNKKDDNKFLEEALKYIKAYEIHDLSSLVRICGDMSAYLEIWAAFTKFIDECQTYDSNFFGKLLEETAPNKNLALKLIDSKYFLGENASDKESCLNFFGRVLKSVDKYDDDYYKNFVCKLIEIDSKFVTENINKKFLAANCEKPELKKLINPKEENYALTEDDAKEMFKYLDPEQERDKKIILEQINLDAIFCRWVSDEFLIENWDNKNIQYEITRRIIEPTSIKGENGLFNFLDVIEKRTDLDAEEKKQASLKLLSFDKFGYKLIDDKRNLDFVIDNIKCKEIQAQLKKYLQSSVWHTEYKKDILSKIQTKTEKDSWDEKRREHAILILISCNYCAAVNFIDIKFLMSHDEGRAAIKDQVFRNKDYKSEDDCFNCILKYLKRKTEKDGWSDKQKKDFISDLILNGQERFYMIESVAFNLNKPLVQDFMKDHLNPDDAIFKSLIDYLNKGYNSLPSDDYYKVERKYFEDRIFYLISLKSEFVIKHISKDFIDNHEKNDLVKSALEKISSLKSINLEVDLNEKKNNKKEEEFIEKEKSINLNINEQNKNEIQKERQELIENISFTQNINPETDLHKKKNNEEKKIENENNNDTNIEVEGRETKSSKIISNSNDDSSVNVNDMKAETQKIIRQDGSMVNPRADLANSINQKIDLNKNKNNETGEEFIEEGKSINSNINEQNNNNIKEERQELMENISFIENIKPELDLNENKNNKEEKTEDKDNKEDTSADKNELELKNNTAQITAKKIINHADVYNSETKPLSIILTSNNNDRTNNVNKETPEPVTRNDNIVNPAENPPEPNFFKAKILHNQLAFAIGFIILSILFGVIAYFAEITLLYIIGAVVFFIGIVFLLAWSIKKCIKKSNDIRKINVLQNDYQEETKTKENIKSEDQSNESEIDTKSQTQISQDEIKGAI